MPKTERYYSRNFSQYEPAPSNSNLELDQYAEQSYNPRGNGPYKAPVHSQPSAHPSYGNGGIYEDDSDSLKAPRSRGTRQRKAMVFGCIAALIIIAIVLGVGLGVGLKSSSPYDYVASTEQVTNETAFTQGGASRNDVSDVNDGIGAGKDEYTYYSGTWENFPKPDDWISFEELWAGNLHSMQHSCQVNNQGKNNSPKDIKYIYDAIQNRAAASLVDHRFILAIIIQESAGCVRAGATTSYSGVNNPGLMQTHDGHSYDAKHANESILYMVQDGTQGTDKGDGLVQNLNMYGNAYSAARAYNSGLIPKSGNLSEAAGATACYVSDVANRLTGWANATSHCEE